MSLLMTGCSSTTQSYIKTIRLALKDRSVNYTLDEIANNKGDLMQIKAGERDQASLGLAFIDGDKHRWVSGDGVVFTLHHGVIVQTEGLDRDLYYTGNLLRNPLSGKDRLAYEWDRKVDIEGTGFGLPVFSTWRIEGEETKDYLGFSIRVLKLSEQVSFPDSTPFIETGLEWENTYYLDATTKELLASKQKFSPLGDVYDMVYLSRVVRLMKSKGVIAQ